MVTGALIFVVIWVVACALVRDGADRAMNHVDRPPVKDITAPDPTAPGWSRGSILDDGGDR